MIARQQTCHAASDHRAALSFVVVGGKGDREVFVDAIRALAQIKRFGDRMTVIGYGRHRRNLEKWATALKVDHLVLFGAPVAADGLAGDGHDVVIGVDGAAGVVLAPRGAPSVRIARGDRSGLTGFLMRPYMTARPSVEPIDRPRGLTALLRRLPLYSSR